MTKTYHAMSMPEIIAMQEENARLRELVGQMGQTSHPDDDAVEYFSTNLKKKLKHAREVKGRSSWRDPNWPDRVINECLVAHLSKGDPLDVAAYCMFLFVRGEKTLPIRSPAGMQLVPVEPTAEMWIKGVQETGHDENGEMMLLSGGQTCRIYAAMLKAARGES